MKYRIFLSSVLTISALSALLGALPMGQANPALAKLSPASEQSSLPKQGLTYAEMFDIEENFVDTLVYSMLATDESMIEAMIDIRSVRVSSEGQYATVGWVYGDSDGGMALLAQYGDEIVILAEAREAIAQSSIEAMGVPPTAAAEIATN